MSVTLPNTLILSPLLCYSKKRLFEEICLYAAVKLGVAQEKLIAALHDRERQGSTVLSQHIAMPHAVIEELEQSWAILTVLDEPVAYNAVDSEPQQISVAYTVFISPHDDYDAMTELLQKLAVELTSPTLLSALRLSRAEQYKIGTIIGEIEQRLNEAEPE